MPTVTRTLDVDTSAEPKPADTMTLNMGPHHPSTHGVLRVILELDGETMVKVTPDIGYLHTGIEKNCEVKPYQQAINLITRADYTRQPDQRPGLLPGRREAAGHRGAAARAVDQGAAGRAEPRLASHLIWIGTQALDVGATAVFLYAFREREVILDLFDMVGGGRMFPLYMRIGGLASYFEGDKGQGVDLPKDFITPAAT